MNETLRDVLIGGGVGLLVGSLFRSPALGAILGAAYGPAYKAAQRHAMGDIEAPNAYSLSRVPRTNEEAVEAFIQLNHSARQEDPANGAFYKAKIKDARAGKYKALPVGTILRIAAATVVPAPQTHAVAERLMQKAGAGYAPAPAAAPTRASRKRKTRAAEPAAEAAEIAPPTSTAATSPGLLTTYRWPLLGGGALLLGAVAWAFWPRRSAAAA